MNPSVVRINKDIRLSMRLNKDEYNVLEKMYPNNISMAVRQLIREYEEKNNIKLTLVKPK